MILSEEKVQQRALELYLIHRYAVLAISRGLCRGKMNFEDVRRQRKEQIHQEEKAAAAQHHETPGKSGSVSRKNQIRMHTSVTVILVV